MILLYVSTLLTSLSVYLPSPHDAHGWGLRVHNLSPPGPYLLGEWPARTRCDVTLINFSEEAREHDPLPAARVTGDLRLSIIEPDGKGLPGVGRPYLERDPFTQPRRLRSGEFSFFTFEFKAFGYGLITFSQAGRHRVEASMTIGGKTVTAPPVEFEVVAVPPAAVLVSHAVPVEGRAVGWAEPVVQQVPVGGRTLLIYRLHYDPAKPGGGLSSTTRLAELPGRCEMTVEGACDAGRPLTITYKTAPDAKPTKLVIDSIGGTPWTEGDERLLQERLSRVAPTPRPVAKP